MVNTTETIIAFTDMLLKYGHQNFNAHISLVCKLNLEVLLLAFKTGKTPDLPVKVHLENSPQGFLFAVRCNKCKGHGPASLDLQEAYLAAHRGGWEHAPELQMTCPVCSQATLAPVKTPLQFDSEVGESLVIVKLDATNGLQVGFSQSVLDHFKSFPALGQNVRRRLQEKMQGFEGQPFDARTRDEVHFLALDVLAGFGLTARRA